MSNTTTIYLRLRNRHYVKPKESVILGDIAQIIAPDQFEEDLRKLVVYQIKQEDKHLVVVDVISVIEAINERFPNLYVQSIGNPEIIIEILTKPVMKKSNIFAVSFVWLLLFIGSGLAIMNFHHDVSMLEVHRRIYYLVTGTENNKPLLLQIPYSFGIGVGMILFFNHIFKKKINEEPSPLEVEMFLYQRNLDQYVLANEKQGNRKNSK